MGRESIANYKSPFAVMLRQLMDEGPGGKKVTIGELAEGINVTRQAVSQYRNGTVAPNMDKLVKIADYLDVSTDYLLGRTSLMSADLDVIDICNKTGLSDEAVTLLQRFHIMANRDVFEPTTTQSAPQNNAFSRVLKSLNMLIEDTSFEHNGYSALESISDYLQSRFTFIVNGDERYEVIEVDTIDGYPLKLTGEDAAQLFFTKIETGLEELRKTHWAMMEGTTSGEHNQANE